MQKLYEKSEIGFAIAWIVVYVVGTGFADTLSEQLGVEKVLTLLFHGVLSAGAVLWMKRHQLLRTYGLCKSAVPSAAYGFYLPLVLLVSVNLWFGIRIQMPVPTLLCYVGSMLCVGFLEEVIFRGFLFRAMAKDHIPSAIIVSSVTFGIGHIINLFNGSGVDLISNLCQVCYAMAFGFLAVTIFFRGKSLWPCILAHSVMNALSAFVNEEAMTGGAEIAVSVFLCVGSAVYAWVLHKTLPKANALP